MSSSNGIRAVADSRRDLLLMGLDTLTVEEGFNVREDYGDIDELAKSIAEVGVRQPLKIRPSEDHKTAVIIDGHRRFKAASLANSKYGASLKAVPCYVEERGVNQETRILDLLTLNSGKPLTVLEQASAIKRLIDFSWEIKDIAKKLGKPVSYVNSVLNLNEGSAALRKAIKDGEISPTAAFKLSSVTKEKQEAVISKFLNFDATKTTTTTKSKPKPKLKVKDVEKATKGTAAIVTTASIKVHIKTVEGYIKNSSEKAPLWEVVKYGLQVAVGVEELKADHF